MNATTTNKMKSDNTHLAYWREPQDASSPRHAPRAELMWAEDNREEAERRKTLSPPLSA